MKTIKYIPKQTSARTEYREILQDDHQWLITEITHWLVLLGSLDQPANEDQRIVCDQWAHRRQRSLPRGRGGLNTPVSMLAGLLDNFLFASTPQRDFTEHQCEALEMISQVISELWPHKQSVRFQISFIEG